MDTDAHHVDVCLPLPKRMDCSCAVSICSTSYASRSRHMFFLESLMSLQSSVVRRIKNMEAQIERVRYSDFKIYWQWQPPLFLNVISCSLRETFNESAILPRSERNASSNLIWLFSDSGKFPKVRGFKRQIEGVNRLRDIFLNKLFKSGIYPYYLWWCEALKSNCHSTFPFPFSHLNEIPPLQSNKVEWRLWISQQIVVFEVYRGLKVYCPKWTKGRNLPWGIRSSKHSCPVCLLGRSF